jgi:hypothetical protein
MDSLIGRILVAAAILVSVLLMLFALTRLLGAEQKGEIRLYEGIPFDAKLLTLDKRALDEAYHAHVVKLFEVWLTDGAREHSRFTNGLKITRNAYHIAVQQITQREQQQLEKQKP